MDAEPLSGMAMPLDIEAARPDPVEPDEGRIEFLAAIVVEAGTVTLQEAVFAAVPLALDINRIVERRRSDSRQEAWLQDGVDERLAVGVNGGLFAGR